MSLTKSTAELKEVYITVKNSGGIPLLTESQEGDERSRMMRMMLSFFRDSPQRRTVKNKKRVIG